MAGSIPVRHPTLKQGLAPRPEQKDTLSAERGFVSVIEPCESNNLRSEDRAVPPLVAATTKPGYGRGVAAQTNDHHFALAYEKHPSARPFSGDWRYSGELRLKSVGAIKSPVTLTESESRVAVGGQKRKSHVEPAARPISGGL